MYGKLFKAITVNILAILLKWDKAWTPFKFVSIYSINAYSSSFDAAKIFTLFARSVSIALLTVTITYVTEWMDNMNILLLMEYNYSSYPNFKNH